MFANLKKLLRNLAPSSINAEESKSMEHVLTVKLSDRGRKHMVVCRISTFRNVRHWNWKFLGYQVYEHTDVTVIDPHRSNAIPVYQRRYAYLVAMEGAHDAAIHALENDTAWYHDAEAAADTSVA